MGEKLGITAAHIQNKYRNKKNRIKIGQSKIGPYTRKSSLSESNENGSWMGLPT